METYEFLDAFFDAFKNPEEDSNSTLTEAQEKDIKIMFSYEIDQNNDGQFTLQEIKTGIQSLLDKIKKTGKPFLEAVKQLLEEQQAQYDEVRKEMATMTNDNAICSVARCSRVAFVTCTKCRKSGFCIEHHPCCCAATATTAQDHEFEFATIGPKSQKQAFEASVAMKKFKVGKSLQANLECESLNEFVMLCHIISSTTPKVTRATVPKTSTCKFWTQSVGRMAFKQLLTAAQNLTHVSVCDQNVGSQAKDQDLFFDCLAPLIDGPATPKIKELALTGNALDAASIPRIEKLTANMSSIEMLCLSENCFHEEDVQNVKFGMGAKPSF